MPMSLSADSPAEQLLDLAQQGDSAALGNLLGLYANYLALLARVQIGRRLRGKMDPADLVQETFLEAHRHFAKFRGHTEAEFVGWLRQILATNLAHLVRRYYSTQRRDVRLECRLQEELDQSSRVLDLGFLAKGSSPSQKAVRREQVVLLADALEQLPDDYREVIILRHLEGKTFPEIAAALGRSLDSVEKVWVRALDRLRRVLGGPQ